MEISFKIYLAEVEQSQVIRFGDMLDKASRKQNVGDTEIQGIEKDKTKYSLYRTQLDQAAKNPSLGKQMGNNLKVAAKRAEYQDRMKSAPTVPHFVVDLQKGIKTLTDDMMKSISKLTITQAEAILSGKYSGPSNEFLNNIIKYRDNPKVKAALENVIKSNSGKVKDSSINADIDYNEFIKGIIKKDKIAAENIYQYIDSYFSKGGRNLGSIIKAIDRFQGIYKDMGSYAVFRSFTSTNNYKKVDFWKFFIVELYERVNDTRKLEVGRYLDGLKDDYLNQPSNELKKRYDKIIKDYLRRKQGGRA
jgi:hypothetical protein